MKIKRQDYCNWGKRKLEVKFWATEKKRDLFKKYCNVHLNMSVSSYINELIDYDEGFKRWLRDNEETID